MYGIGVDNTLVSFGDITLDTLRTAVDSCINEDSRGKVRFKSVVSYDDPLDTLERLNGQLQDTDLIIESYQDHYHVKLERVIRRADIEGGQRTVTGELGLFQSGETDIWVAVTGNGPDFYKRGLIWLIKRSEPEIYNFFVNSKGLRNTLEQLEDSISSDFQIYAQKAIAYSHTEEGNISYETRPFRESFDLADDDDRYVDKIKFDVRSDDRLLLSGFMSRDGQLKLLGGSVNSFFDTVIPLYTEEGQNIANVVKDKQRSDQTGEVQPIELEFDDPVFQSVDDNQRLIQALEDLTNSSVTVYHNNPYAHVSVLDFIDGSSCDVFITEPSRISLVPSYNGSPNSLMRISDKLSRELNEGSISSTGQAGYEFSDFFA